MRARAGRCFSSVTPLDHVSQGDTALPTRGVGTTQTAEWQSEPPCAPRCDQRGGWEDMESQRVQRHQDLHWFSYSPAARGHGFRWRGLTLGQVFLIIPIRATAHGALRCHLACPHTKHVISLCMLPKSPDEEELLLKVGATWRPVCPESDSTSCMGGNYPQTSPLQPRWAACDLELTSREPLPSLAEMFSGLQTWALSARRTRPPAWPA